MSGWLANVGLQGNLGSSDQATATERRLKSVNQQHSAALGSPRRSGAVFRQAASLHLPPLGNRVGVGAVPTGDSSQQTPISRPAGYS